MKLGYCFNKGGPNTNQHAIENKNRTTYAALYNNVCKLLLRDAQN